MTTVPVSSLQLEGKKVLVRCDFNVPLDGRHITDPTRIDASLDTIRYITGHGAAAILCSHLGRPKERSPELSLKPVAEYLSTALARKVTLIAISRTSSRAARIPTSTTLSARPIARTRQPSA